MRHRLDAVRCLSFFLTAAVWSGIVSTAAAQSTAFTYQGSLDDAGAPANGLHDFRVLLFNAASGGVVVGLPQCADNVDVIDGVFTLQLDFGQAYATTVERHLAPTSLAPRPWRERMPMPARPRSQ